MPLKGLDIVPNKPTCPKHEAKRDKFQFLFNR